MIFPCDEITIIAEIMIIHVITIIFSFTSLTPADLRDLFCFYELCDCTRRVFH